MTSLKESVIFIQDSLQVNKQLTLNIKADLNSFKKDGVASAALAASNYKDIMTSINKLEQAQNATDGKIDYLVSKINSIATKLAV